MEKYYYILCIYNIYNKRYIIHIICIIYNTSKNYVYLLHLLITLIKIIYVSYKIFFKLLIFYYIIYSIDKYKINIKFHIAFIEKDLIYNNINNNHLKIEYSNI